LDAGAYLTGISTEVAHRFATTLPVELAALAARWGEGFRPLPDEAATLVYSRPVFQHLMRTGQQRRRRSSAGVWQILYDVLDADGDGAPETLRVLLVRHSAARPLSIEED
jgi:hypothetical protein